MPDVSNASQLIIKEMNRSEEKFTKIVKPNTFVNSPMIASNPLIAANSFFRQQRRANSYKGFSSIIDNKGRERSIEDNLKLLGRRPEPRRSLPANFAKTNVRKSSFDPIIGCEKVYSTPIAKFSTLGARGCDSYNINGFFRQANPSKFQISLRSY